MINKRRRVGAVAVLATAGLALSACGGSDSGSASASEGSSTLRVGVIHWVANTEIKLGMEDDFFKDEGIDTVELEPLGPPPTIIAALQSKKIDIGVIPTVDYLTALSQNLKLTAVAPKRPCHPDSSPTASQTRPPASRFRLLSSVSSCSNEIGS